MGAGGLPTFAPGATGPRMGEMGTGEVGTGEASTREGGGDRVAARLIIHGRVQGVYYRNWTVAEALGLGLDGWVRNRTDGTVETLLAGPREAVETLIARCHQGPPAARVAAIDTHPADDPGQTGFHKLPTV